MSAPVRIPGGIASGMCAPPEANFTTPEGDSPGVPAAPLRIRERILIRGMERCI